MLVFVPRPSSQKNILNTSEVHDACAVHAHSLLTSVCHGCCVSRWYHLTPSISMPASFSKSISSGGLSPISSFLGTLVSLSLHSSPRPLTCLLVSQIRYNLRWKVRWRLSLMHPRMLFVSHLKQARGGSQHGDQNKVGKKSWLTFRSSDLSVPSSLIVLVHTSTARSWQSKRLWIENKECNAPRPSVREDNIVRPQDVR